MAKRQTVTGPIGGGTLHGGPYHFWFGMVVENMDDKHLHNAYLYNIRHDGPDPEVLISEAIRRNLYWARLARHGWADDAADRQRRKQEDTEAARHAEAARKAAQAAEAEQTRRKIAAEVAEIVEIEGVRQLALQVSFLQGRVDGLSQRVNNLSRRPINGRPSVVSADALRELVAGLEKRIPSPGATVLYTHHAILMSYINSLYAMTGGR